MEIKSLFEIKPEVSPKVSRPIKTQLVPLLAHSPGFSLLTRSSPRISILLIPFPFFPVTLFPEYEQKLDTPLFSTLFTDTFLRVLLLTSGTLGFSLYLCYSGGSGTCRPLWHLHGSTLGRAIFPCPRSSGHPTTAAPLHAHSSCWNKSQGHWERHWGTQLCCLLHPTGT